MTARAHFVLCLAAVLALCLTAPAQTSPRTPENPYDRKLADLQSRFQQPGSSPPESAIILGHAYRLRDRVDDPAAFDRWMEQVAAAPGLPPLVQDEALHYVALDQVHTARLDDAEATLRKLGFIRQWAVLGPFPRNEVPPVERDLTLGSLFAISGKRVSWRATPEIGPQAWVDLADLYAQADASTVFLGTSVRADVATAAALRFSAESPAELYVNGSEVFRDANSEGIAFDQHSIGVHLHAGWNTIVAKLRRESEGQWRFGMRITAPNGGGIALPTSLAPSHVVANESREAFAISDLVQMAARTARMRGDLHSLEVLGGIEKIHATGTAFEDLEAAAQAEPTAGNWLDAADLCPDTSCVFNALTAALRAQPDSEPAKLAFAEYYAGRGQMQKARDLLLDALGLAPGDFVARKRLADVQLSAGMTAASAAQYAEIERESPASIWARRELAAHYEDVGLLDRARALVASALREDCDGAEERALLLRIDERRLDATALRADYDAMRRLSPSDVLPLEKLAALDLAAGDAAGAVDVLRRAVSVEPGSSALHQQLADALASQQRSAEALSERKLAAALDPRDPQLQRRLRESAGATQSSDPDSQYLADAAALAAAARRSPPPTSGEAIMLANIRVQRVFANGLNSVRQQQVIYLSTDEAAADYGTSSIQYSPATEKVDLLNARLFKSNGTVVQAEEAGENAVADSSVSMYYDVRSRVIRFPGAEKGDLIELDYRTSPVSGINRFGDYFGDLVAFRGALAQSLERYVLIAPASRRLSIGEQRMAPAMHTTGGDGEQIYRWEMRDMPALANEPRGPALTEVAPYVLVSTFGSWDELGRWYAELIRPQFALDGALRAALNGLLAGTHTDEEKIRAVHDFVVRNTHYVALEFGIYGFKPYPVSQTYARRFGDCKDKASLMIALLRAAGIDADIALVRTRRLGDIGQQPASISIFNHAIVYIPKYQLWLDGTAEYSGSHELPTDDQGAMALTVSLDGRAQLRRIPVSTVADNVTRRVVHARVLSDGRVEFSGNFDTRGEDAPVLRRDYEVTERQRDQVRDRLAEVFPTVRVEDVRVEGAHDLDHDVSVNFRGVLDTFAGRSTFSLATSWMPRSYVQKLAPLATRSQDLVLVAPWQTEEEIHLSIPRSATYVAIPPDQRLETPFGTAVLRYELNGRDLTVRTAVQFRAGHVSPSSYPAFRAFCAQVERSFRNEIKVSLAR